MSGHEHEALCAALMKHHELTIEFAGICAPADLTIEQARGMMVFKTAADTIDTLHARLDADQLVIEAKDRTIYRLRAELENQRLSLLSMQGATERSLRRVETVIGQTLEIANEHETAGVQYADGWPEQQRR